LRAIHEEAEFFGPRFGGCGGFGLEECGEAALDFGIELRVGRLELGAIVEGVADLSGEVVEGGIASEALIDEAI